MMKAEAMRAPLHIKPTRPPQVVLRGYVSMPLTTLLLIAACAFVASLVYGLIAGGVLG